jgi:hypothetical protein
MITFQFNHPLPDQLTPYKPPDSKLVTPPGPLFERGPYPLQLSPRVYILERSTAPLGGGGDISRCYFFGEMWKDRGEKQGRRKDQR